MATHGRRKTATSRLDMTVRVALIVLLCSGLCACVDEVADIDDINKRGNPLPDDPVEDQQTGVLPEIPTEASPDITPDESTEVPPVEPPPVGSTDVLPDDEDDDKDDVNSPQAEDTEVWGTQSVGDVSDLGTPSLLESEAEEDQSEAPEESQEKPTEEPSVETKPAPQVTSFSPQEQVEIEPTATPQEPGDYIVFNDDNVPCLRARFAAVLKVDYVAEDENGQIVNRTAEISVPAKADTSGYCSRGPSALSALRLEWEDGDFLLSIIFKKQNASIKGDPDFWEARKIQFAYDTRDTNYFDSAVKAGQRIMRTDPKDTFFVTAQGNSRICEAEDDIIMLPGPNKTERVTLEISQLKMQPYGLSNGTFSEGADCGKDLIAKPSTNVASVAVGATLACLILVVIIVYAVGRKMGAINDRSGYKSVE